jgi:uncharacterized protein (DUF1015 family)
MTPTAAGYEEAAQHLHAWVADGLYALDERPALYVYEMRDEHGRATRGLVGALQLRDPDDGVILPHENTMAGPVADRLELMTATDADLEPIYLVYDGGGPASDVVRRADANPPLAEARTPDGVTHRLWAIAEPEAQREVAADLATRRALIADGHHRYATYRERQRIRSATQGAGPWDRGLALVVDSSDYGPQVHAIHRVVPGLSIAEATGRLEGWGELTASGPTAADALGAADEVDGFAAVLTDGRQWSLLTDPAGKLRAAARRPGDVAALAELDVTLVHRGVIEAAWALPDDVETVHYAHSIADAIEAATAADGLAILLRPTPVAAVAAVAAQGGRMPRKSTLFTPKPASGLVIRRLGDQPG